MRRNSLGDYFIKKPATVTLQVVKRVGLKVIVLSLLPIAYKYRL